MILEVESQGFQDSFSKGTTPPAITNVSVPMQGPRCNPAMLGCKATEEANVNGPFVDKNQTDADAMLGQSIDLNWPYISINGQVLLLIIDTFQGS